MLINDSHMRLTKDEAVSLHRDFWNKIASDLENCDYLFKTAHAPKHDAIKVEVLHKYYPDVTHVNHNCFLCDYVALSAKVYSCSKSCPLFDKSDADISCLNGYYNDFMTACITNDKEKAIECARSIAEKPERED